MDSRATIHRWAQHRQTPESNRGIEEGLLDMQRESRASLITTSNTHHLDFRTGYSVYKSILPAIEKAEHEVILVTCFWARSRTLDILNDCLRKLSAKGQSQGRRIRVRICFSSSSLFQKLFHTSSLSGQTYGSSQWQPKFGLPHPDGLTGLDMEMKSIFVKPFSVMHPKFIVVDRARVFLPSCNISWEDWFEGCIEFSGPIVQHFVHFWQDFWANEEDSALQDTIHNEGEVLASARSDDDVAGPTANSLSLPQSRPVQHKGIPTVFLPSPHHVNPHFSFPWQPCPAPPETPLNTFLLDIFANAKRSIRIQTPNLTAPPVLSALLRASRNGVNVDILTSERLMILEQLVTVGTTTKRCLDKLMKRHTAMVKNANSVDDRTLEGGHFVRPGSLSVSYYRPSEPTLADRQPEPVQSHLKLTIVDQETIVFGSGNMDRASWYTSQELGVAFLSRELVESVTSSLDASMSNRSKMLYSLENIAE